MIRVWWCRGVLGLWGVALICVALIHAVGQRHWLIAPFVYAPQQIWPMGMVALAVLSVKFDHKLTLLLLATAAVLAWPLMDWHWPGDSHAAAAQAEPGVLRVMTCNRGESYGHSIADFMAQERPDVLAIQDAGAPLAYNAAAPEFQAFPHVARQSQFVLLSRYPVLSSGLVVCRATLSDQTPMTWFKGARFVVQFHQRQVAIYSVHMPSPRYELHAYKPLPMAHRPSRGEVIRFWEEQDVLDEQMLAQIEADPLPVIVLGDWNIPSLGPLYRRLTLHLADAHTLTGSGYGFTFPGDVSYAAAVGGPWLRLDDVFCSKEWTPLESVVEPANNSQHSAVAAVLKL